METEKRPTEDTSEGHGNLLAQNTCLNSSDEDPIGHGVGAGGKGKKKCSASSSRNSKTPVPTSTKKLTKSDELWPKDLPDTYTKYIKSCNDILRAAVHQGTLDLCWAIAISRYIEALLARRNIMVELSPQHLVNHIRNKDITTGRITKYNEIKRFLMEHGLVLEKTCPFTGEINQICPKSCQKSDERAFKIKDLVYFKTKEVNEEDVIKLVNEGPVLAVVEAYQSFQDYKDGIYEGQTNNKDPLHGRHVVIVSGFGSTSDGVHYWIIQNSWGTSWGQNGFGHIIRKISRAGNKPSMFLKIILLVL